MSHLKLVKAALDAIEEVFSDTSVSPTTTLASLAALSAAINTKSACLESDIRPAKAGKP